MQSGSTTETLDRLIGFDTTSDRGNLELIGFARDLLAAHGVPFHESRDPAGRKANLHALIGPAVEGGLALSGHVDTVPVAGQAWTADPYRLRAGDGRLYGRGTCDMKGFVAAMLAAVPDLVAMDLARPVHLLMTFDEETTMAGARRLVAAMDEAPWPRPALCVIGEPSEMRPVVAHKGRLAARVTVRGAPGHSAHPERGRNAIHLAAEAIGWAAREAERLAAEGPFAEGFDPPHTTSQVGVVQGGRALNIIPELCVFEVEWRPIPGFDAHAALARLEAAFAGRELTAEVIDYVPGMSLPPDHPLATLVRRAAGSNATDRVSYATEGGLYEEAGIPTIVCGPGSIAQAHMPDEFVAQDQLDACDAFIRRLAGTLAR